MSLRERIRTIERWPRPFVEVLGGVLLVCIGALDYLTGPRLSFSVFYLIPIATAAWLLGRRQGVFLSIAGSLTWLIVDLVSGHQYPHFLFPLWNSAVRLGFFIVIALLLVELKHTLGREETLARTDFLTGSANGRAFYETSELEIKRSQRYGHPFTVAYIDLDDFKLINDLFGHLTGDALLQTVARTVRENLRAPDTVARLGGDEFILLLPETGADQADAVIRKIRDTILAAMQNHNWPVTVSIGAVVFMKPPPSAKEMVKQADDLMYAAKKAGKNAIRSVVVR